MSTHECLTKVNSDSRVSATPTGLDGTWLNRTHTRVKHHVQAHRRVQDQAVFSLSQRVETNKSVEHAYSL